MRKMAIILLLPLISSIGFAQSISHFQTEFSITQLKPVGPNEYIVLGATQGTSLTLPLCTSGSVIANSPGSFLGRYNSLANCWSWVLPATPEAPAMVFDVDNNGNVLVAGSFNGTVNFPGNFSRTSVGLSDLYLMKINSSGNVIGVVTDGSPEVDRPHAVQTDGAGNVYVSGIFNFDITHAQQVNGNTVSSIYIAKFNNSLTRLWRNSYQGFASDNFGLETKGEGIALDNSGNIYQSGVHAGNVNFSRTVKISLSGSNAQAGFLVKYNSSGAPQWARSVGKYSRAAHVTTDAAGNPYLSGHFWNSTINFGNNITLTQNATASGNFAAGYVARFNPSGIAQWARKLGGSIDGTRGTVVSSGDHITILCAASVNADSHVRVDGASPIPVSGTINFVLVTYSPAGMFSSMYMPTVTGVNSQNASFNGINSVRGIASVSGGYMVWAGANSCSTCSTTVQLDNANVITANGVRVHYVATFLTGASTVARSAESPVEKLRRLTIYPNPAARYLSVYSDRNLGAVHIYDINGRKVYQMTVNETRATLDLSDLPSGTYILETGGSRSVKFVKQ